MKKLIVLTDFSKTARNAANIALEIAINVHLDVQLVNSYLTPFAIFAAEGEGRTPFDVSLIAVASENGLKKEVKRLCKIMDSKPRGAQKTVVETISTLEPLPDIIGRLTKSNEVKLVVAGVHESTLPFIFSGMDAHQLLKGLNCPLLIVPKTFRHLVVNNLMFASNAGRSDLEIIDKLYSCSRNHNVHFCVCHVSKPVFVADFNEEDRILKFGHELSKIGRGGICLNELQGANLVKSLNRFVAARDIDMIAIAYYSHSFGWELFHENHVSKLIKNQRLPMLIFPANSWQTYHGQIG
ncbi:MAG: universal stress protein [Sphingobacteriaceae bacterium]|nr:universal stress protein [Sphingobacteriaceae bacterium]